MLTVKEQIAKIKAKCDEYKAAGKEYSIKEVIKEVLKESK